MGVAKTSDTGKTWQMVWRDTDATAAANIQDPWINQRYGPGWGENPCPRCLPRESGHLFGTDFGRTMRTRDGGKTWQGVYARRLADGTTMTTGLDVLTTNGIHFDPFDADHWFVSFADLGLFEARKGGQSWKEATSRGIPREWQNTSYWAVFDPTVKGRIWAAVSGVHDLHVPKCGETVIRKPSAAAWSRATTAAGPGRPAPRGWSKLRPHTSCWTRQAPPGRAPCMFAVSEGVSTSPPMAGGAGPKNNGLEGSEPFAWRIIPDSKGRLYLLVVRRGADGNIGTPLDGALYRSSDGAEHWEKLTLPADCNSPNGLAIDPSDTGRLYLAAWGRHGSAAGDTGGGIFLSTDAGKTWKSMLDKDQHIFDVTLDTRTPNVLYATGFESSVWKSVNRGESWIRLNGYNFKWGQRVFPDPVNAKMIYVARTADASGTVPRTAMQRRWRTSLLRS